MKQFVTTHTQLDYGKETLDKILAIEKEGGDVDITEKDISNAKQSHYSKNEYRFY